MENLPTLPEEGKFSRAELLQMEKEVMGIYLSDHPLRGMEQAVRAKASHSNTQVLELEDGASVTIAGVISNARVIVTKSRGEKMASLVMEDFTGQLTAVAFPATYAKLGEVLQKDQVVWIRGSVTHRDRPGSGGEKSVELRIDDAGVIEQVESLPFRDEQSPGIVVISMHRAKPEELERLKSILAEHPGDYGVMMQFGDPGDTLPIPLRHTVDGSPDVLAKIRAIAGKEGTVECIENPLAQITTVDPDPDREEPVPALAS